MSTCDTRNVIFITQGNKEDIFIGLKDPDEVSGALDLSQFESGKAIFKTSTGTAIEKVISFPVTDPKTGVLNITLDSVDTEQFDHQMRDFELELTYTGAGNKFVKILKDVLEVTERL
jgi:hypothetical protein